MNKTISFKIDQAYYEELYQIWLINKSRTRKWQPFIILILLGLAIGSYFHINTKGLKAPLYFIPVMFLTFTINELYDWFSTKRKWMKERMASKMIDKTVTFNFTEDHIQQISLYSKSEIQWNAFLDIKKIDKGLLLKPDEGFMLFLPKLAFENEETFNLIYEKLKTHN